MSDNKTKPEIKKAETSQNTIGVILAAVVGLVFRGFSLTEVSIWHNEALSIAIAQLSWQDFAARLPTEPFNGLYYILLKLWTALFGFSELSARGLSAILGSLLVVVVFLLAKKIFGDFKPALIAAILVAVNPLQIQYSQTAQPYALAILLATLSCYLLLVSQETTKLKAWVFYGLVTAGMLYADITFWPVWLAQVVFLSLSWRQSGTWKSLIGLALPVGLSMGLVPAIMRVTQSLDFVKLSFWETINIFWQTLFAGFGTNRIVASLGVLLLIAAVFFFYRNAKPSGRRLLACLFVFSSIALLFFTSASGLDAPGSLLVCSIALIIILAGTIHAIPNYSFRQSASAVLLIFSVFMVYKNINDLDASEKPGTAAAMQYFNDNARKEDFLYTNNPYIFFPVKYYNQTELAPKLVLADSASFTGERILTETEKTTDFSLPKPDQNAWVIWSRGFGGGKPVVPGNWELVVEKFYADTPNHKGLIVVSHYHVD